MKFSHFLFLILKAFGLSFGWYFTIIPPIIVFNITAALAKHFNCNVTLFTIVAFALIQILFGVYCFYDIFDEDFQSVKNKFNNEIRLANKEKEQLKKDFEAKCKDIENKEQSMIKLLSTKSPFKYSANMLTDMTSIIFNNSINWLKYKPKPAYRAAEEVGRIKSLYNKLLVESKEKEYKYEYILDSFPEIREYVDSDEDLIAIGEHFSYSELEEQRDRRKDYLSLEEYSKLSETEKSQLALDRYLTGRKSKWQIGRDYEMCCAFQLRQEGFKVEMHGIKYGLGDLGRDLIAHQGIGGLFGKQILIIQCKNWNKDRVVHENVIMQLFGSATAYAIEYKKDLNDDIIPVLMVPSYTQVSKTAISFAEKLKVKIMRTDHTDYPHIKCNVNHGERIYHLPFDQLYDRTEIKNKDECYAYTVKEAESKGFRRAQRHYFSN